MMKIGVLGLLLPLGCKVNQQIEAIELRITVHDGDELLFVKHRQRGHRLGELIQQALVFFAKVNAIRSNSSGSR